MFNANAKALMRKKYNFNFEKKLFHVGLPSYVGAYADFVSRQEARIDLGISPNDFVVLGFGAFLPYKNFEAMLDALPMLNVTRRNVVVVLAGAPSDGNYVKYLKSKVIKSFNVIIATQKIADSELQYLMNSADLVWAGYAGALTSGVAMTAVSFGVPIIGPSDLLSDDFAPFSDVWNSLNVYEDEDQIPDIIDEMSNTQLSSQELEARKYSMLVQLKKNLMPHPYQTNLC